MIHMARVIIEGSSNNNDDDMRRVIELSFLMSIYVAPRATLHISINIGQRLKEREIYNINQI